MRRTTLLSLDKAEDFAETLSLTESVRVPAGTFHHCLKSQETTPLETDLLEYKFYPQRWKCLGV
jgi:hypothetical protein